MKKASTLPQGEVYEAPSSSQFLIPARDFSFICPTTNTPSKVPLTLYTYKLHAMYFYSLSELLTHEPCKDFHYMLYKLQVPIVSTASYITVLLIYEQYYILIQSLKSFSFHKLFFSKCQVNSIPYFLSL